MGNSHPVLVPRRRPDLPLPPSQPTSGTEGGEEVTVRAESAALPCLCLQLGNVRSDRIGTQLYAWARMKEVEWADSLDSKSDPKGKKKKKKKVFADSSKETHTEKNPHGVQRDLCLIRQKQFLQP